MNYTDIINAINDYLHGPARGPMEIRFSAAGLDGFEYISIDRRIEKGVPCIVIGSSGYDDILPSAEAVSWLDWALRDLRANGFFPVVWTT